MARRSCEFVLVAEFDIDEGSVLRHEYPVPTGCNGHLLAELMLPDGAHLRTEDWTVFLLNQTPATTVTTSALRDGTDGEAGVLLKSRNSAPNALLYTISLVRTRHGSAYKRGAAVKALAICTPHPWIQVFKPVLLLALEDYFNDPTTAVLKRLYDCINAIDIASAPQMSNDERLILRYSDRKDLFEHKFPSYGIESGATSVAPTESGGVTPAEEVSGYYHPTRRSMTPVQVQVARATPDQYSQSESSYSRSRVSSNASVTSQFLPNVYDSVRMERKGSAVSVASSLNMRNVSKVLRDTHFYDTVVTYNDSISMPIRIPLSTFPAEVGDYSLITLIQTFSNYSSTVGPLHPQLHTNGNLTPPIIVLFNSIITGKRVLFLGGAHQPASQVANFVLSAAALASGGGQFFGTTIIERCFPYSNLTNMENHLSIPGYIAGVTNPRFEDLTPTWDVLCNIETGRITVSKDITQPGRDGVGGGSSAAASNASHLSLSASSGVSAASTDSHEPSSAVSGTMPFGAHGSGLSSLNNSMIDSDIGRVPSIHQPTAHSGKIESRLDFPDNAFMDEILLTIHAHYGENAVRARISEYVRRFLRLASRYEEESIGFTSIDYTTIPFSNGRLGSGPAFHSTTSDELRRELASSATRIESWRRTTSYEAYKADWIAQHQFRSSGTDISHQVAKLRFGKRLSTAETSAILQLLSESISTDGQVLELLAQLPLQSGGVLPISFGLFHPVPAVRSTTVDILNSLNAHPTGAKFLQSLNTFHRLAYARLAAEKSSNYDTFAQQSQNGHPSQQRNKEDPLPPVPVQG